MAIKIFKKVKNLINDLNKISTIRVSIDELINEVKNLKIQIKILIEKKISNDDYRSDARIQACQLYSFIKDDEIREQLSNHYEKMIKNQKKSFAKYCFHSHVQTELLINFYYNNKLTTPKEVEKYFNDYQLKIKGEIKNDYSVVDRTPCAFKLTCLSIENQWKEKEIDKVKLHPTLFYDLKKIQILRNDVAHGSSLAFSKKDELVMKQYEEVKLKSSKYKSEEEKNIYKEGIYLLFKKEENYYLVKKRSETFVKWIKSEIEKQQQKN